MVIPILLVKTVRLEEGKKLVLGCAVCDGGAGCEPWQADVRAPMVDHQATGLPREFLHGSRTFTSRVSLAS